MNAEPVSEQWPIDQIDVPPELRDAGAWCAKAAITDGDLATLGRSFEAMQDRPGERLPPAALAHDHAIENVRRIAANFLGKTTRVVRCLLLDKHDGANWALAWHQDRTIAVQRRLDVAGLGPWTIKGGTHHVAPPIHLLSQMLTARIHLDAVDADNAPLLIVPGSHRLGRITEGQIDAVVATGGTQSCLADRGDVWFYSMPILHASARAKPGRRRRVVQIDLAAFNLPGGLKWSA